MEVQRYFTFGLPSLRVLFTTCDVSRVVLRITLVRDYYIILKNILLLPVLLDRREKAFLVTLLLHINHLLVANLNDGVKVQVITKRVRGRVRLVVDHPVIDWVALSWSICVAGGAWS